MARGTRAQSTDSRNSDTHTILAVCLLVYEKTHDDDYNLTTSPGLPIVPSSPFYQTLQELWTRHGNRDATPSIGLIRAVAADIQRRPRLWNFAIYRSWVDYEADLQYVLLQSTRASFEGTTLIPSPASGPGSANTNGRGSPRRNRFVRVVSGYLAEGSGDEN